MLTSRSRIFRRMKLFAMFVSLILPIMGTAEENDNSSISFEREKRMEERFSFTFGSNRPNGGNSRPNGGSNRPNGGNNGGQIVSTFLSLLNNVGGNNRPNNGNNGGSNSNGGHSHNGGQNHNGGHSHNGGQNGGYSSSNGGFSSSNGGLSSSNGGFGSSNGGFGSSNGGFGSSNGGFGSPNGGFSSSNGGFSSSNGGFSSSNGGFSPSNGGSSSFGGNSLQTCSPRNQCGKGQGDCETDQDCSRGLFCGKNNCKGEFGSSSEKKDDCCTDNRFYCNRADLLPNWRRTCCSPSNPCPFKHGDCDKDSDCVSNLVCGDNNCKDFHSYAGNKDDCCTYPEKKKKRSVEGNETISRLEDIVMKPFKQIQDKTEKRSVEREGNETISRLEDLIMKPFKQIQDETEREKRDGFSSSNRGFSSSNGGYSSSNGGFGSSNGGFGSSNGGFGSSNGGFGSSNGGFGSSNGGFGSSNGGFGSSLQACTPSNKCSKGHGDCETDQDCRWGLFCGKNNCRGEFGSRSPQGIPWENKDDCCTDNSNFCNQAEVFPSSRRTCCSSSNPCPFSHGDCDTDADCQFGLMCGDNNCKDFHTGAGNKDDCCTRRDDGGRPSVGSRPTANSGCEGNPSFRCCTKERPCSLGGGDCNKDNHCEGSLVCGSNNCRKFHPNADKKMDCCAYNKF